MSGNAEQPEVAAVAATAEATQTAEESAQWAEYYNQYYQYYAQQGQGGYDPVYTEQQQAMRAYFDKKEKIEEERERRRKRPARKQAKPEEIQHLPTPEGGEYNIWYHKYLGDYEKDRHRAEKNLSAFRCKLERDAGYTKGDKMPEAYICLYFARGRCILGSECTYLHREPTDSDETRLSLAYDIFGRERHRTDREDMGGTGNFSRENKTLYIGNLKKGQGELEDLVRKNFEEFGEIEYIRAISSKNIGFVTYKLRASAEFAKEAMSDQTLGNGDVINVRWANEDPNPAAKTKKDFESQQKAIHTMIDKHGFAYVNQYQYPEYPETDAQYVPEDQVIEAPPVAQPVDPTYSDGNYVFDVTAQDYFGYQDTAGLFDKDEDEDEAAKPEDKATSAPTAASTSSSSSSAGTSSAVEESGPKTKKQKV